MLSTKRMVEALPEYRQCTNRQNGCGSGQLHEPEGTEPLIMKCYVCGWFTCTLHKEQMHFGLSCDEYDLWRDASRALAENGSTGDAIQLTEALLQKKSRKCPECQVIITKMGTFDEDNEIEACHHMTCPCGAEFCWLCGGFYYGGDPSKRKRVRECLDETHLHNMSGYNGGTLLHCHHKVGCNQGNQ